MKIEIECANCQSLLRLDEQHAGKQVRCPVCGVLTQIPDSPQPAPPRKSDWSEPRPEPPAPDPGWQGHQLPPTYRPERPERQAPRYQTYPDRNQINGYGIASIVLGVFAFFSAFGCVCFSPVLSNAGIVCAFQAKGIGFMLGMVFNLIALLVWFMVFGMMMLRLFF